MKAVVPEKASRTAFFCLLSRDCGYTGEAGSGIGANAGHTWMNRPTPASRASRGDPVFCAAST